MSTGDRDSYDVLAVQVGMAKRALCGDVDAKHDDFRRECERAPLKNRVVDAVRAWRRDDRPAHRVQRELFDAIAALEKLDT